MALTPPFPVGPFQPGDPIFHFAASGTSPMSITVSWSNGDEFGSQTMRLSSTGNPDQDFVPISLIGTHTFDPIAVTNTSDLILTMIP